jgi:hypothetical protein
MNKATQWTKLEELNEWTGEVHVRYIAQVNTTDRTGRAYLQVQQIGGRWHWSVSIVVAHKPKLTKMAYGAYAVTPYSLPVAKGRAMRRALKTIRRVELLGRAA